MKHFVASVFAVSLLLAASGPCSAIEDESEDSQLPINRRATMEAWDALREGDAARAIAHATECIERFQKPADTIQSILEQQKAILPTGEISGDERARVDRYQILHDVAACLLIKGWAEEKLGRSAAALAAFEQARKYTFARVAGEPVHDYWSAAEVAADASRRLRP